MESAGLGSSNTGHEVISNKSHLNALGETALALEKDGSTKMVNMRKGYAEQEVSMGLNVLLRNDSGSSTASTSSMGISTSASTSSSSSDSDSLFSSSNGETRRTSFASSLFSVDEKDRAGSSDSGDHGAGAANGNGNGNNDRTGVAHDNMLTPVIEHDSWQDQQRRQFQLGLSQGTSSGSASKHRYSPGLIALQLDSLALQRRASLTKTAVNPSPGALPAPLPRRSVTASPSDLNSEGFPWSTRSASSARSTSTSHSLAATPSAIFWPPIEADEVNLDDAITTSSAAQHSSPLDGDSRTSRASVSRSLSTRKAKMHASPVSDSAFVYSQAQSPTVPFVPNFVFSSNNESHRTRDLYSDSTHVFVPSSSRPGTASTNSPSSSRPGTSTGPTAISRPWIRDSDASSVRSFGTLSSDGSTQEPAGDTLSVMSPAAPPPIPCEYRASCRDCLKLKR